MSANPPAGVEPRYNWEADRAIDLAGAIGRYASHEWIKDFAEQVRQWAEELAEILEAAQFHAGDKMPKEGERQ